MKASAFPSGVNAQNEPYDDLADFLETDEGKAYLDELDQGWQKVMRLAERHGFISSAYGGVAMLAIHQAVIEQLGTHEAAKRLRMYDLDIPYDLPATQ